MTVSTTNCKHVYTANGSQTEWPYTFPIYDSSDIAVYVTDADDVTTKITSNFSVDTDGGFVKYPTTESLLDPVTSGYLVTIRRETPQTQEIDLINEGALNAETLEDGYDKLTMMVQTLGEEVSRAIKYPVEETPSEATVTGYLSTLAGYAASASASAANAADSESDAASSALSASASAAASAASALAAAQYASDTEAELDERFSEGTLDARPVSLGGVGFYYATDIHQLFFYSPTNGWEAK